MMPRLRVPTIETVDDCFKPGGRHSPCSQTEERLKRLHEANAEEQMPRKGPKTLMQQSAQLVIRDMIDQGNTEPLVAALVAQGKAEDVVKQIIAQNPAAVKQVVKGLMSTARGIRTIPKVRKPEMQDVMVVKYVDEKGFTRDLGYVWLKKHTWFHELIEQDPNIDATPRSSLGGWTLNWSEKSDALEWVTRVLRSLKDDAATYVYLDANFDELFDWGSDDEDVERDEDDMTEYERFMDDCELWNRKHYKEYAPRFVDMIYAEVLASCMSPAEVDTTFTCKYVSLDTVGMLTVNPGWF